MILRKFSLQKFLAFVALLFIFSQAPVSALSDAQRQVLGLGIYYFNTDASNGSCDASGSVGAALPSAVPEPYNSLFSQAASLYHTNPQFLAAIFLSENGNTWKPFNTVWATSGAGAKGPFQFEPGTWDYYAADGNNDGVKDINNIYDATYAVGNMLQTGQVGPNTPLGSLDHPFKSGTFLEFVAAYNWGGSNVQMHTTGTSPITGKDGSVPVETQNYIKNVYSLLTSGFTKSGNPNYGDPQSATNTNATGAGVVLNDCSSGVVAGNIAQTALNLSWPGPHEPQLDAKAEYTSALNQYNQGGLASYNGADCGAFVATVMRASGADTSYPALGTPNQQDWVMSHPDKYDVFTTLQSTSELKPGDILIVNSGSGTNAQGHTLIWVGPQTDGYNEASASEGDRMPSLGTLTSLTEARGHYIVARLKGV